MPIEKRMRILEICKLLGRTRSTFDRWRANGKVPQPDGHDPYPYWLESTVKAFVEQTKSP